MEGFTKVSVEKAQVSIDNYNKLTRAFKELEDNIEELITSEVETWGWLPKFFYEVSTAGTKDAWLTRYGGEWYNKKNTYRKKGKITATQNSDWREHEDWREYGLSVKALVVASTNGDIQAGEKLCAWINRYSKEISIE